MIAIRSTLASLALVAAAGVVHAAGLEGAIVSLAGYCCSAPVPADRFTNIVTATVGSGVEFAYGTVVSIKGGFVAVPGDVDISGTQITMTAGETIPFGPGAFNGSLYTFAGVEIVGVTLDAASTFAPLDVAFDASSIAINVAGESIAAGQRLILDVTTTAVPEPAAGPLVLAGIALVALGAKRRRPRLAPAARGVAAALRRRA
jgi:hypothetical protein